MPNTRSSLRTILIILALTSLAFALCAETASVTQTKTKLRQLDAQISKLKQTLNSAHDKRGLLNQELAENEKQIGTGIQKLHHIQKDMDSKRQKISGLQQRVNELNKQLSTQQQLLADHIRIRYKMGEYQPVKWILNQDDPYSISRLITFHQYLVRSRQHIIAEIDMTKKSLTENQNNLKQEIENQRALQKQLHVHQEQLEHNKNYHTAVIQSLNNDIQSKQLILNEFERNKENLSRLLKTLSVQSVSYSKQPFVNMRHKLTPPVREARQSFKKMNQGVTFFAGEGAPVYAVYSGKIVFSDWLNGYGLLLIIDHGQGFMTLYAHNQSLFKHKGTTVLQGQQIAAVGHSGGIKQNGLYFEVRQRGKAVPPLDWLSQDVSLKSR
ncbi:MAG: peptidoglycan DD-metalloendopeptidase family protein [Legionella sp.]|nr:peptidoglycan DD-metalloendopeptidase family protein [Legionella sp.]